MFQNIFIRTLGMLSSDNLTLRIESASGDGGGRSSYDGRSGDGGGRFVKLDDYLLSQFVCGSTCCSTVMANTEG